MTSNTLFYGDNLAILRDYIPLDAHEPEHLELHHFGVAGVGGCLGVFNEW